jgi:predicted CXXCH cytochrome family protein
VARRVAELKRMREDSPELLLLSAGDFYSGRGILEMYRSRFLANMMVLAGYDAAAVGENELSYELKAIREEAQVGLPVICANLYLHGERLFPPYVIKKSGGSKIGIFALLGEDPPADSEIELRDPFSEGISIVSELRSRGCDMVILLAHFKRERLKPLIDEMDGIDLVIRGHTERGEKASIDCSDTTGGSFQDIGVPVLYSGDKGRSLGWAVMTPDDGSWELTDTMLVMLPRSSPVDTMVASMLRDFHLEEGERRKKLQISQFVSRDPVTGRIRERYIGMETCARCHSSTASDFMMSPHYRTFRRLTESENERNEKCLPCHSTGYGRFSGYDPESDEKGGIYLRGVQCEACHGPGTEHTRDGIYRERARKVCRQCHDAKNSPHFVFQTFWAKVGHRALADSSGAEDAHR